MTAIEVVFATRFIGTQLSGNYRTKVLGLQQQSDERFVRISVWYHKLEARRKQTALDVVAGNQLGLDLKVWLLPD